MQFQLLINTLREGMSFARRGHLLCAIRLILRCNYFDFLGNNYHQVSGLAMGTSCAPPVAQFFMYELERIAMQSDPWPVVYERYLDDVEMLWEGTVAGLLSFGAALNRMHPHIVFTFKVSTVEVVFLDLGIYVFDGALGYSNFVKPLNIFQYIPRFSCHAPHVARGWILTELLRLRRTSSTTVAYLRSCNGFYGWLRQRGYTVSALNSYFSEAETYVPRQRGYTK